MISWFQALMPKEERFFDLFERHALTIEAGAYALRSLLDGGETTPDYSKAIKLYENEADEITREACLLSDAPSSRHSTEGTFAT